MFDGTAMQKIKEDQLEERNNIRMTKAEWDREEGKVSFSKYHDAVTTGRNEWNKFLKERRRLLKIVNHIAKVEPTFCRPYFKIEIDTDELEALKQELNNT